MYNLQQRGEFHWSGDKLPRDTVVQQRCAGALVLRFARKSLVLLLPLVLPLSFCGGVGGGGLRVCGACCEVFCDFVVQESGLRGCILSSL